MVRTKTKQSTKNRPLNSKAKPNSKVPSKLITSAKESKQPRNKSNNLSEQPQLKKQSKAQSTVLLGLISGLTSLAIVSYIGISSKDYLTLKSDIASPTITQPGQTIIEEQEITSQKLPSIEPDLDALKLGQKNGIIGRDNPMSKLFLTEEDLDEILAELGATSLTDDEMKYIVANLAVNTTKNYSADKNLLIQSVLELQQEQTTTPSTTTE